MNIYVAGVSGESQYVKSLRTFYEISLRPGDMKQERASGRGDVSRILACNEFLELKEYDAIAMFDLDMLHDPDILEKLRTDMEEHNLDMVTGHYYARESRYIHSIIWEVGDGKWPFLPMLNVPHSGLHEVAITGMGNVLIKREVVEAVKDYLPKGDNPFSIGAAPEIAGDNRMLGTDFRFFAIARKLGYKLWLDAEIESKHGTIVWMDRDVADRLTDYGKIYDYMTGIAEQIRKVDGMDKKFLEARIKAHEARVEDLIKQYQQSEKTTDLLKRQLDAIRIVLSEDNFLLSKLNEGSNFPTVPEDKKQEVVDNRKGIPGIQEEEARQARENVLQKEAKGFVEDIQTLRGSDAVQGTA